MLTVLYKFNVRKAQVKTKTCKQIFFPYSPFLSHIYFFLFFLPFILDHQPLHLWYCSSAGQYLPQEAGGQKMAQHGQSQLHPEELQTLARGQEHAGDCQKGRRYLKRCRGFLLFGLCGRLSVKHAGIMHTWDTLNHPAELTRKHANIATRIFFEVLVHGGLFFFCLYFKWEFYKWLSKFCDLHHLKFQGVLLTFKKIQTSIIVCSSFIFRKKKSTAVVFRKSLHFTLSLNESFSTLSSLGNSIGSMPSVLILVKKYIIYSRDGTLNDKAKWNANLGLVSDNKCGAMAFISIAVVHLDIRHGFGNVFISQHERLKQPWSDCLCRDVFKKPQVVTELSSADWHHFHFTAYQQCSLLAVRAWVFNQCFAMWGHYDNSKYSFALANEKFCRCCILVFIDKFRMKSKLQQAILLLHWSS